MSAESKLKDAAATTEAAVGEELDEASVWETEFWKVREEQQEEQHAPSAATAETRAAAGKENLDLVYSQPHHRKRQSFVLNDDDDGLDVSNFEMMSVGPSPAVIFEGERNSAKTGLRGWQPWSATGGRPGFGECEAGSRGLRLPAGLASGTGACRQKKNAVFRIRRLQITCRSS